MPTLLETPSKQSLGTTTFSTYAILDDLAEVPLHVARYDRSRFALSVVKFLEATRLLDWCEQNEVLEAIGGGFYNRHAGIPLGDLWIDSTKQESEAFVAPWSAKRASIGIDEGEVAIGLRTHFPDAVTGSLLQAGPLLVHQGMNVVKEGASLEGFSEGAGQFDSDITDGRYPRSAIGINNEEIITVACDGSSADRHGLALEELADVMLELGANQALNLDGGGSSTLISGGKLINKPYGDGQVYARGRAIFTALVLRSVPEQ